MTAEFVTSFLAGDGGQRFDITKSKTDDFMMKNILEIEVYVKRKKAVKLYEAGKWEPVKTSLREAIHKEAHKFSPNYLFTLPTREFQGGAPSDADDNFDGFIASSRRKRRMEHDDVDDVDCLICLDGDVSSEFKILPCAHVFHQTCLSKWLGNGKGHGECPSCRRCIRCHCLTADIVFRFFDVKASHAPMPVLPNNPQAGSSSNGGGTRFGQGDITIASDRQGQTINVNGVQIRSAGRWKTRNRDRIEVINNSGGGGGRITINDGNNNHPGSGNTSGDSNCSSSNSTDNNGTQSNQGNPRQNYDRLQFLD